MDSIIPEYRPCLVCGKSHNINIVWANCAYLCKKCAKKFLISQAYENHFHPERIQMRKLLTGDLYENNTSSNNSR